MMKKKLFFALLMTACLGMNLSSAQAQSQAEELTLELESSAGLSARYPATWSGAALAPFVLVMQSAEGWRVQIDAGESVVMDNPQISVEEALPLVAQGLSKDISAAQPLNLANGTLGYRLSATLSTDAQSNIPALVATFNLPDGTIVRAFISNNSSFEAIIPQAEANFLAILDSLSLSDPQTLAPEGTVALADLEEGELRFGSGISTRYPQGWVLYRCCPCGCDQRCARWHSAGDLVAGPG